MGQPVEYDINIDNDEVEGAGNGVTVFINARIKDANGETMGIVGVGFRVGSLQALLEGYEKKFGVNACLVSGTGEVEVATDRTGYEGNVDFFGICAFPELKSQILENQQGTQTFWHDSSLGSGYVVSRYIPNLNWHLIVAHDTTALDAQLAERLHREVLVLLAVITMVLVTITNVIRRYNRQIIDLTVAMEQQHRTVFQEAAEQLYENIYEVDVTHNRAANETTEHYFESLGAPPNTTLDNALRIIAEKQVKEEYRQGYLDTFSSANVLRAYEEGNESLRYDFLISPDGKTYYWMRITAHIFFWGDDSSVRMLVYRENIDAQKRRELYLFDQMQKDSLTGLLKEFEQSLEEHNRTAVCPLSIARGIAVYNPSTDLVFANVFKRADDAMYQNKKALKEPQECGSPR